MADRVAKKEGVMLYRVFLLCVILLHLGSRAFAQDQASIYRETYPCEEGGSTSTCILGTIPRDAKLTLVARDQAIAAKAVRELPDQYFSSGKATGTLVEASRNLPPKAKLLAVLAPVSTFSVIQQEERSDAALVRNAENYVEKMNREFTVLAGKDHRWLNPHVTTQIIGLTGRVSIAEVTVGYDAEVYDTVRKAIAVSCTQCGEEKITLLINDGGVFELLDRKNDMLCSDLISAFQMSGRTYVFTVANGCNNGLYVAKVLDVSGSAPQPVFFSTFFSD